MTGTQIFNSQFWLARVRACVFTAVTVSSQLVRAVLEKSPSIPLCKRGKQSDYPDALVNSHFGWSLSLAQTCL